VIEKLQMGRQFKLTGQRNSMNTNRINKKMLPDSKAKLLKRSCKTQVFEHLRGGESCYYRDNMAADGFH
jgi:hypothetical protein